MKILVAGDDAAFELAAGLVQGQRGLEVARVATTSDDGIALAWAADAEDTEEIARLVGAGWRVFAVARDDLRSTRVPLLDAGAEDVCEEPPTRDWLQACIETVKPSGNRREVRYVATVPWSLARSGGAPIEGNLVNVSRGGFKVRLLDAPAVGELLVVTFAGEAGVPPLYARVLSATMATQSSWWIRARFVALRPDEVTKLERWLDGLKREDVDPVKALIALDAMTARDLASENNAIGGVRIPPLSSAERRWVLAPEGSPNSMLAGIPLARARAQGVATVLGGAPDLAFDPPLGRWMAEIAIAQAMARDPSQLQGPDAAAFKEAADRLDASAQAFQRAIGKYVKGEQRRESAKSEAAAPVLPAEEPMASPSYRGPDGSKPQRTAMSLAAKALAPKTDVAVKASPVPKNVLMGVGAVAALIVGILLATFIGHGGTKATGPVDFPSVVWPFTTKVITPAQEPNPIQLFWPLTRQ